MQFAKKKIKDYANFLLCIVFIHLYMNVVQLNNLDYQILSFPFLHACPSKDILIPVYCDFQYLPLSKYTLSKEEKKSLKQIPN